MINQLILYRGFAQEQTIFLPMVQLLEGQGDRNQLFQTVNALVELAKENGFEGNLWHCYLAYVLATHENAFSATCERAGKGSGSINDFARHDFAIFQALFAADLENLDQRFQVSIMGPVKEYRRMNRKSKAFNSRVRDEIETLCHRLEEEDNADAYLQVVSDFYKKLGVGKFGLHKAFRVVGTGREADVLPITNIEHIYFTDLIGYELQKKKLITNTEAFIQGKKANNCLLYGDSGTGKSSSVKALMNEYYSQGLRMIEVYKHQFCELSAVIAQIKDRNYKFIIFMDDLSFEDFEIEYKYLKAIIEGGLEKKPDNVLIYATSNRRHIIREKFSDKRERQDDLHGNDTVQEKLSLVARFGVQIYYGAPERKEFEQIVLELAKKFGVEMSREELILEANAWELRHGGISGRTAIQFITDLLGKKG